MCTHTLNSTSAPDHNIYNNENLAWNGEINFHKVLTLTIRVNTLLAYAFRTQSMIIFVVFSILVNTTDGMFLSKSISKQCKLHQLENAPGRGWETLTTH